MSGQTARLRLEKISKTFPGTKALTDVSLSIQPGEVRALVGENGAGKSTLMNIIGGVFPMDEGEGAVYIDGKQVKFTSPTQAIQHGVGFVHQELSMFQQLSVAYNIFVDRLPMTRWNTIDRKKLYTDTAELLKTFSLSIPPDTKVSDLTIGSQQMVEIVRTMSLDAKLVIFDEPTSSLSEAEVEMLFTLIRKLKSQGISMIYITHKMSEIFTVCDSVSVLRDGVLVDTVPIEETTMQQVINSMVGREVSTFYPDKSTGLGEVMLQVEDFCLNSTDEPISFNLHRNEILGFYGLIGAGRSELLRSICGIDPKSRGEVRLGGEKLTIRSYQDALDHGITYLTEDRKGSGIFPSLSVFWNMYVSDMCRQKGFFLNEGEEREKTRQAVIDHGIKTSNIEEAIMNLSGGNQQKAMFSRCLRVQPKVVILDEPTRGVDVNAKAEIHRKIRALAEEGIGVIVISSEMPEMLGLSDEVVVMHEGRMTGLLRGDDLEEHRIIQYATEIFTDKGETA